MDTINYIKSLERTNEELLKSVIVCKESFLTSQRLLTEIFGLPFSRLEAR